MISARSAYPKVSKKAVHVNEILRRLLNTISKLDWDKKEAPVLSEYEERIKNAVYNQYYRQHVLQNAIAIHDAKFCEHDDGVMGIQAIFFPWVQRIFPFSNLNPVPFNPNPFSLVHYQHHLLLSLCLLLVLL